MGECPSVYQVWARLNLEETDLDAVTAGIATGPKCEWAGPINLKTVEEKKPKE